jgi:hypothetical protein
MSYSYSKGFLGEAAVTTHGIIVRKVVRWNTEELQGKTVVGAA